MILTPDDDDDVYLKSNPTQKCRPAKGISKRGNIQILKGTDIIEQPNNKYLLYEEAGLSYSEFALPH
jgi:hypothetical protein